MENVQRQKLGLKKAYAFGIEKGLSNEINEIRNMEIQIEEWGLTYTSALRRGFIVDLFEHKGILSAFINQHWPEGATPWGEEKRAFYLELKSDYEDFLAGNSPDLLTESEKNTNFNYQ